MLLLPLACLSFAASAIVQGPATKPTGKNPVGLAKITRKGKTVGTILMEKKPSNFAKFPALVFHTLTYSGSWPKAKDWDRFEAFDLKLRKILAQDKIAINPLVVMVDGKRDWFVYASNPKVILKRTAALIKEFKDCHATTEVQSDPKWAQYDVFAHPK